MMKTATIYPILLIILFTYFYFESKAQNETKNFVYGSYINTKIIDYYNSSDFHACEDNFFDNKYFEPLYITINKDSNVEMTLRYEQNKSLYKIQKIEKNSFLFVNEYITRDLIITDDLIKLEYNGNEILLKKVTNLTQKDVFGEFIKSLIFAKNENLYIDTIADVITPKNLELNEANFLSELKGLFNCEFISFAELATFKYNEQCLPSLALYFKKSNSLQNPYILGIQIADDYVKLLDKNGSLILKLLYAKQLQK